jgi:DNA-binding protein WhiA
MRERPSFTDEIKAELANIQPARPCCQHAELRAIVGISGFSEEASQVTLRLTRNAVARKVVQLARSTGGSVSTVRKGSTAKRPSYHLRLTLAPSLASNDVCCARAVVRGAFLARGLMGNPARAYHLEIVGARAYRTELARRMAALRIPVGELSRRGSAVHYLKGAEPISRLLGLIGANRAVMRLENDRIVREMRGDANRRANSETANLDKRLRAAFEQVQGIRRLARQGPGLRALPAALRETADLRLAHPRAGLQELAERAHLTKSAMAHRLRRLMERAVGNGLIPSAGH